MREHAFKHSHIKHFLFAITVGLGLTGISSTAQAAVINLDLTGIVANASTWSSDDGISHYDSWYDDLSGMPVTNSIVAYNGDTVDATVTLDHAITMPASGSWTYLALYLYAPGKTPGFDTATSTFVDFSNGGIPQFHTIFPTVLTTSDQIVPGIQLDPPDNGAITFDKLVFSSTITKLGNDPSDSLPLTNAFLLYQLTGPSTNPPNAVPEPASMLLLGLGGAGLALRRRLQKNV